MADKKNVHVVPHKDGWAVRSEGSERADSVHDRKSDAMGRGREIAENRKGELFDHGRDGKIQNRNSFGNDPCPPKDKKH